ncbi:MAG: hypothetical protein H6562_13550 [Lewinellaceae bacterium]|nr:hypothetical protein [Lewinella sp.]MCB9279910.1 hypothetical protein [Lewinellaceae bacterium]
MTGAEILFNRIAAQFTGSTPGVTLGKMMSSPGLKYSDKVFAFYHKETMGFRLGKQFDPEKFGLKTAHLLNPFKNKPPIQGWFIVEAAESEFWEPLAEMALEFTRKL